MFFNKKKIRRTRSRNVLQTELLESRAMFSATEMPQVDDSPIDDSGLDIPACERPYGQDASSEKGWKDVLCWFVDLVEGAERLNSETNDLGTGINEPPPKPVEEELGPCYSELDKPEADEAEEEKREEGTKKTK